MLLSPVPYTLLAGPDGPKFHFHQQQPGISTASLVLGFVVWAIGLLIAFFAALSSPGFWGQGIGKFSFARQAPISYSDNCRLYNGCGDFPIRV